MTPHRIRDGLIEYLEVMQLAGVSELGPPRPGSVEVALPQEESDPIERETVPVKKVPVKKEPQSKTEQLRLL